jgi:hypothetical protein
MQRTSRIAALIAALAGLASCGGGETAISTVVTFESALVVEELWVAVDIPAQPGSARDEVFRQGARLASGQELLLLLPDDWSDQLARVTVIGAAAAKEAARGDAMVRTQRGDTVSAAVALVRPAPPAVPSSPAPAPSQPPAPPQAPPSKCSDECSPWQSRCSSPTAMQRCTRTSASACWKWASPTGCPSGTKCGALGLCMP